MPLRRWQAVSRKSASAHACNGLKASAPCSFGRRPTSARARAPPSLPSLARRGGRSNCPPNTSHASRRRGFSLPSGCSYTRSRSAPAPRALPYSQLSLSVRLSRLSRSANRPRRCRHPGRGRCRHHGRDRHPRLRGDCLRRRSPSTDDSFAGAAIVVARRTLARRQPPPPPPDHESRSRRQPRTSTSSSVAALNESRCGGWRVQPSHFVERHGRRRGTHRACPRHLHLFPSADGGRNRPLRGLRNEGHARPRRRRARHDPGALPLWRASALPPLHSWRFRLRVTRTPGRVA